MLIQDDRLIPIAVGPEQKPFGRQAWSIPLMFGCVIDLSITPRVEVTKVNLAAIEKITPEHWLTIETAYGLGGETWEERHYHDTEPYNDGSEIVSLYTEYAIQDLLSELSDLRKQNNAYKEMLENVTTALRIN